MGLSWKRSTAIARLSEYLENEDGGATAWNLAWLAGFAVIGGVSIDSTNARRVETMLSSTADVAALAGSMELPSPHLEIPYSHGSYGPTVEAAALEWALKNMTADQHGDFIENSDIFVGHWDHDARLFTWGGGGEPINAVRVDVGRNATKGNSLSTTLLRLTGFNHWEINTAAIAAMKLPECFASTNALISAEQLMVTSNAIYFPDSCIHGEGGVKITNNNIWWPDTGVSAGFGQSIDLGPNQFDQYGADTDVHTSYQHLLPSAMAEDAVGIARAFLDLGDAFGGSYDDEYPTMRIPEMQNPSLPVIEMTEFTLGDSVPPSGSGSTWLDGGIEVASLGGLMGLGHHTPGHGGGGSTGGGSTGGGDGAMKLQDMRGGFDASGTTANLDEFRTYYAPCTNKLTIDGTIRNVVLVSECKVDFAAGAAMENSVLIVIGEKGKESIGTASNVRFGADDGCSPGGGMRIFTTGDFNTAASTSWYEVQVYVGGDFTPAGQTSAGQGLQAHVAGEIHISAQLELGGIAESVTDEDEGGPSCTGSVGYDWISTDYHHVLVH